MNCHYAHGPAVAIGGRAGERLFIVLSESLQTIQKMSQTGISPAVNFQGQFQDFFQAGQNALLQLW